MKSVENTEWGNTVNETAHLLCTFAKLNKTHHGCSGKVSSRSYYFFAIFFRWFEETFFDLLRSYHKNRTQYVQVDNEKSDSKPIKCGVSQGSVLGLILFLIYSNDLLNTCQYFDVTMFADDTNIYGKIEDEGQKLSRTLSDLSS